MVLNAHLTIIAPVGDFVLLLIDNQDNQKPKILLVEDNEINRMVIKEILKKYLPFQPPYSVH